MNEMEIPNITLGISLDDFIAADSGIRRKALIYFKSNILPVISRGNLMQLFFSKDDANIPTSSLQHILLEAVSDDGSSQLCREWALEILTSCIQIIYFHDSLNNYFEPMHHQEDNKELARETNTSFQNYKDNVKHSFQHTYILVCELFHKRFQTDRINQRSSDSSTSRYIECSEEIRLGLVRLISLLISYFPENMNYVVKCPKDKLDEEKASDLALATSQLCHSLSKSALYDTFPDLTRESCVLLQAIARRFPVVISKHAKELFIPICGVVITTDEPVDCHFKYPLLCHKHSKSRLLALDASFHILSCYIWTQNHTLDINWINEALRKWRESLPFDHSIQVRNLLAKVAGSLIMLLLQAIETEEVSFKVGLLSCVEELVTLLLYLVSDDDPSVVNITLLELKQVYPWCRPSSFKDDTTYSLLELNSTHAFIIECTRNILSRLIYDASENYSIVRIQRAIAAVGEFIQLLCDRSINIMDSDVHRIVDFLCDSVLRHDIDLIKSCTSCAFILGNKHGYGPIAIEHIEKLLDSISNIDANSVAASSNEEVYISAPLSNMAIASKLCIVSSILDGTMSDENRAIIDISYQVQSMCSTIAEKISLEGIHSSKELAYSLLKFCQISAIHEHNEEVEFYLFYCCLILRACPDSFKIVASVDALLHTLSVGDMDALYRRHFKILLKATTARLRSDDVALSSYFILNDPYLLSFEVLLRTSSSLVISDFLYLVVPIIEHHLSDNGYLNYEIKIFMMALLESILSHDTLSPKLLLHEFSSSMLEKSIIPNLVWKPGGKASAVRKLTAATFFTLLKKNGLSQEDLTTSLPRVLPVLKSSLDDDDSVTRELVCHCLSYVFKTIPDYLDEDEAQKLYPLILKTLDDNSDNVRFAGCLTLRNFVTASRPFAIKGSITEYIIESLLIHLDDPGKEFQHQVRELLAFVSDFDHEAFLKTKNNSTRLHRF